MPTRTKKEKASALVRVVLACAVALALAVPGAALADTSLGIRVYKSEDTPSAGEGITTLGIKVDGPVYTITWNAHGGVFPSGTSSTTKVRWGTPTVPPTDPTKEGYAFQGWSPTEGGSPATPPAETTGDHTWHAVWKPIDYTITYNLDGGTAASNPSTYTIETQDFTLNNPTKEGYTFTGWSGTDLTGEANMSVTVSKGSKDNRSYTAHWKLNEYQVTFMANDGTDAKETQTFQHGVAQNLKQNTFTRQGYEFLGWSEDKTATTAQYQDGASLTVAGTKTLHAIWKSLSYTIVFNPNGGTGSMDPMDMIPGQKKALTANAFTHTGYTFKEWNTEKDGSGQHYADKAEVDFADTQPGSEVKLYAQWTLQVDCDVPMAAIVTVDASGEVKGENQDFISRSVAPLKVSAVKSSKLAGADSVFADPATLSGIRVTLTPPASAGSPVHVPLETADPGQPASFTIPTNGTLSVSFGLTLPTNARLSFLESAAQVAQLSYVIGPASSQ